MVKLRYIDKRVIYVTNLKNYAGVSLPKENPDENILIVTETEAKHLLRQKNGNNPTWEIIEG